MLPPAENSTRMALSTKETISLANKRALSFVCGWLRLNFSLMVHEQNISVLKVKGQDHLKHKVLRKTGSWVLGRRQMLVLLSHWLFGFCP